MKIIIFGSGTYYHIYKSYLNKCNICFIVDNDKKKQGTKVDGIDVYAPDRVDYNSCEYIVIMVKENDNIRKQLLDLKVDKEKIITYLDIGKKILLLKLSVFSKGREITAQSWIDTNKCPRIMVLSHELSRTGVPVAMMHLTMLLKKMGYSVLLVSMKGGSLHEELEVNNIDYIKELQFLYRDYDFLRILKQFKMFVLGTVGLYGMIPLFSRLNKPIVWWIHESDYHFYLKNKAPGNDLKNVFYFAGGRRVLRVLQEYWKLENAEELLYFLPEIEHQKKHTNDKIIFSIIGTIGKRKAQDILLSALEKIPMEHIKKYEVLLVGTSSRRDCFDMAKNKPNVQYIGEMKQSELNDFYRKIDVLVCPSRDDPMPIVVTQAMQNEIPCIVSDQVGQAEYIQSGKNGYIFKSEDVIELARIMEDIIVNPAQLNQIGKEGKKIYEENFSEKRMQRQLLDIFKRLL